MNKVSVLIPLFNSEETIVETIESVRNQSYSNLEIIVVDDGSTDNSLEVARGINDERLIVISQENGGACSARNKAIKASTGEYIQFLDADDLLSPDKIKNQMELLSKNGKDALASCRWARFVHSIEDAVEVDQIINKNYFNPVELLIDSWCGKGMTILPNWLTPKRLIEKAGFWNEELSVNQDGEYFSRVVIAAEKVCFDQLSCTYYRFANSNSISQRKNDFKKAESLLKSFKLYEQHMKAYWDHTGMRKALATNYAKYLYHYDRYAPSLSVSAWSYLNGIKPSSEFIIYGSKKFKFVAKFMGFRNTLSGIRVIHRLKS